MTSSAWRSVVLALLVPVSLTTGACAKAQASVGPETPPLTMPPAPPRVISPIEVAEVPAPAPVEPEPSAPDPGSATRGRTAREAPPKPEATKPEPDPRAQPRAPARLSTPLSASNAEVERQIRETIARAVKVLDSANVSALTPDAKAQYDTARRFIMQAEEGLVAKNYVFAGLVADKAETLAAGLVRR